MTTKLRRHLATSSFLLLTSALFTACSQRADMAPYPYGGEGFAPPSGPAPIRGTPASYTSSLEQSHVASRKTVPMSDDEAASQPAGTTVNRQTAASETVIKKGATKQQSSTTEEVIETNISTIVETIAVPTSDEDAR